MNVFYRKLLPLLLLTGLGGLGTTPACRAEAQTPPPSQALQALQAEVGRLQGMLQKIVEATPEKSRGELTGLGQQLDKLRQQPSPSAFVYQLRNPFIDIELRTFLRAHGDAGKDFASLQTLWTAEKARFAPMSQTSRPAPAAPLLAALAEMSENHAQKVYRAALPYGKAAGPGAGAYYLGEAEGNMAFHDFVARLTLPAAEKVPDAATLRTVLESLEGEMQKDFAADPGGQELIPASAMLKEARELVERDFRAGAALTLLRSRLELSRHRKGGAPASAAAATPEKAAEGSLIAPFVAMTTGDQDETARIVRADVIPLYRSFFRKNK